MSKQDKPIIDRLDTGVAIHIGSYCDVLVVSEKGKRDLGIQQRDTRC